MQLRIEAHEKDLELMELRAQLRQLAVSPQGWALPEFWTLATAQGRRFGAPLMISACAGMAP
jgi:hypothetical protein